MSETAGVEVQLVIAVENDVAFSHSTSLRLTADDLMKPDWEFLRAFLAALSERADQMAKDWHFRRARGRLTSIRLRLTH